MPPSVAATSLAIIGLANIAGSLTAGSLGNVFRMKWLLFWTYFTRAAAIAIYISVPRTALTFYVFAAVLGFTWLSTVPPTAGLVGKLFGVRYLATLFGLTLADPSDWRIFWRMARRHRPGQIRRLRVDVVRGHDARARRGVHQSANSRGTRVARADARRGGGVTPRRAINDVPQPSLRSVQTESFEPHPRAADRGRIHILGALVSSNGSGARLDGFKPALEVRKIARFWPCAWCGTIQG